MDQEARLVTVDHAWSGRWSGRSLLRLDAHGVVFAGPADAHDADALVGAELPHVPGTVLAPFTDSHVHLGLVDAAHLPAGGIARVVDLGWDPAVARGWLDRSGRDGWPEVSVAGGLVTAPGGYPSRSGWAPPRAALAVGGLRASTRLRRAARVVGQQHALGATVVKVALNSDVGPVLDDATLAAVVDAAHGFGLPVVAHVQGAGQAARALEAGVDRFAHTPFSERLDDDLIARLAASTTWISTLDIHGPRGAAQGVAKRSATPAPREPATEVPGGSAFLTAVDNLSRFRTAGGRVLYGTDLGNGDLPLGVNERELRAMGRAGFGLAGLLEALAPDVAEPTGGARLPFTRVTWIADAPRASASSDERAAWLAGATALTADELLGVALEEKTR
ncbi:amidohydrolase [Frigoribacterium sp. VKM Ac-1396]|uniref:amidohydrolase family protein n=1 Tax=Frigoribacterium sp. VKM Ac-1396 TaxID=2783821 RepID=UPI00188CBFF4|nr:amidohydrolase [Frigoribacterium sp. VKM Ac-1396]MBF4601135.1 amidohydrolase [Frigoribacterium sp. VKM Ac-1396]